MNYDLQVCTGTCVRTYFRPFAVSFKKFQHYVLFYQEPEPAPGRKFPEPEPTGFGAANFANFDDFFFFISYLCILYIRNINNCGTYPVHNFILTVIYKIRTLGCCWSTEIKLMILLMKVVDAVFIERAKVPNRGTIGGKT